MENSGDDFRYWAFISYSSNDAKFAKKLHKKLETYRIPRDLVGRPGRDGPVPRRVFPIFRDREELPLSAELGASIEDALRASRYLIVVCSPLAAQSKWVNEEIRYFKSIGRADHILAMIIDGEPHGSEFPERGVEECFPPALRFEVDGQGEILTVRTEPIAGDLRAGGDGWTSAFLKAMAGITGLGLNAFTRREKTRQRRRKMITGLLGFLCLGAGLWGWDYNRVKVNYYANITELWGVPEGVYPLSKDEFRHRESSYRIASSRRKVREVRRMNSLNNLSDNEAFFNASVQEVAYREDGSVEKITLKDHNGKATCVKNYSAPSTDGTGETLIYLDFKTYGDGAALSLLSSFGSIFAGETETSRSEITGHRIILNAEGLVEKEFYLNNYRQNRANADGVFGKEYTYNVQKVKTKAQNLDLMGNATTDKKGVAFVQFETSSTGEYSSISYWDLNSNTVYGSDGYHKKIFKRDRYGNDLESSCFDIQGNVCTSKMLGIHRSVKIYGGRGFCKEQAYLGVDDKPTLSKDGIHQTLNEYDTRGNRISVSCFGVGGKPARDSHGIHQWLNEYDARGNQISEAYFGVDDKPTLSKDGMHKLLMEYDARGNQTSVSCFGVDDKPTLSMYGIHNPDSTCALAKMA